jgi:hypothetical protein
MKNCDPFVLGPALAILNVYGLILSATAASPARKDLPVVLQLRMEFILKLVTPDGFTTGTIAKRVTRLQHLSGHQHLEESARRLSLTNFLIIRWKMIPL